MNVGSLFSGIGGMDHGLARAGFRHLFFCESDEWRRGVLAHHWPGVPIYDDVRSVGLRPLQHAPDGTAGAHHPESERREQSAVDLLCGGFPCQDLSVAGQRRGLAGTRSGLFFEFARIIDALQPRFVLIENVPGLLSSNGGRDFGTVLGALAELGYGLGWRILDSRYFGVPQRRRRVFILGTLAESDSRGAAQRAGQVLAVGTRCPGHPPTGTKAGQDTAVASLSGLGTGGPDDNDAQAGRVTAFSHTHGLDAQPSSEAWPFPRKGGGGHGVGIDSNVRRLTPVECERLQSLPDNWTDHGPDSRRYAALGDAVTSTVAEWIGRRILAA